MKKITLFVLSIVALASAASAQMVTPETQFTSNPENFKGKVVIINGVNLRPKQAVTEISVGAPSTVTVGKGSTANVVASCKKIKGFKSIDVDFKSSPTFATCFYMNDAMYNSLPINQDVVKGQITFKGDKSLGYIISLFKAQ
jgi:hypothetical protein